jgi:hypothetical protein
MIPIDSMGCNGPLGTPCAAAISATWVNEIGIGRGGVNARRG